MEINRRRALLGGLGASLCGLPAAAQDITFFRIGTGGTAGTYFPIGGLIANAISNPPGSRAASPHGPTAPAGAGRPRSSPGRARSSKEAAPAARRR